MTDSLPENTPVLYSFRRCPYAMRGRMGLYQSGIITLLREIELKNKPSAMLDVSPKGTVPVLVLADGKVIDESLDIMAWALGKNDPDGWLDTDKQDMEFLIARNDNEFKGALDRYKYPNRYPGEDCSGARDICETVFSDLDERLQKNGGQLLEEKITMADIALFPFIRQCANVDRAWFDSLPAPHLQKWLKAHLDSALFKEIMPKFKIWQDGDDVILFGKNAS